MRLISSAIGVAISAFVAACTAGSAPSDPLDSIARDPPYASPTLGCATCASNLRCIGSYQGTAIDTLVSSSVDRAGNCDLSGEDLGVRLQCDGQIVVGTQTQRGGMATPIGSWSSAGDGVVLCVQNTCIVCLTTTDPVPSPAPQPTPVGGGGISTNDAG